MTNTGHVKTARHRNNTQSPRSIRYVWFDAECAQERQILVGRGTIVQKHECLLLCSEVLCINCLNAGITTREEDDERMAPNCACGLWPSDHPNRHGRAGEEQHRYSRRLIFESFQQLGQLQHDPHTEESRELVWRFMDYLLSTGPANVETVAISHNGGNVRDCALSKK